MLFTIVPLLLQYSITIIYIVIKYYLITYDRLLAILRIVNIIAHLLS